MACGKSTAIMDIENIKNNNTENQNNIIPPIISPPPSTLFPYYPRTTVQITNFVSIPATADFNNDGHMDLLFAGKNLKKMFLLLADERGLYREDLKREAADLGTQALDAVVNDFDNDGHLDFVAISASSWMYYVYLGDNQQTFTSFGLPISLGSKPSGIFTADFNQDGNKDFIVMLTDFFSYGVLQVYHGHGDGTFSLAETHNTGFGAYDLSLGDVNNDGAIDVVSSNFLGNSYEVFLGSATGLFVAQGAIPVGVWVMSSHLKDLNGDQHLDLLLNTYDNSVKVAIGRNDGTFSLPISYTATHWSFATGITVADFDGDHKWDVVGHIRDANWISFLKGSGDASLQAGIVLGSFSSGPNYGMAQDYDGDGKQDLLLIPAWDGGGVVQTHGHGDGTFASTSYYSLEGASAPQDMVSSDFNGDGYKDIAITRYSKNDVALLMGQIHGTFAPLVSWATGTGPMGLTVCDFDQDGINDLVIASALSASLSLLKGQAGGTFHPVVALTVAGSNPQDILCVDLDQDQKVDLVSADALSGTLSFFKNLGAGVFSSATSVVVGGKPVSLDQGDINHDGYIDLVVANYTGHAIQVLYGTSTFASYNILTPLAVGFNPRMVKLVDIAGDGALDIVSLNYSSRSVSLFTGQTDGSFLPRTDVSLLNNPKKMDIKDVNNDGFLDMLISYHSRNTIHLFKGHSTGNLTSLYEYRSRNDAQSVASPFSEAVLIEDINNDQIMDLLNLSTAAGIESLNIHQGKL